METLEKRLRRLRLEKKFTQEELAQQLHVTRQAVSNWENGKTVVGIEYLMKLSELYGVSVDELLHGERAAEPETYPKKQRKYIVVLVICAAVLMIGSLMDTFLEPWLLVLRNQTFDPLPWTLHRRLVPGAMAAALGAAIPAAISLNGDIRLWGWRRRLVLTAGVLCLLPVMLGTALYYGGAPWGGKDLLRMISGFFQDVWANRVFLKELFFLSGGCFFLGLNR